MSQTNDAPKCPKCSRTMSAWGFQIINDRDHALYICDGAGSHSVTRTAVRP